ncbi:MAG: DUF2628 domain-containing protein [Hyphomicrobiales bacterium]
MAAYRVFEFPNAMPEQVQDGRNVELIRDGFSVLVLLFPVLWLLWNRVWLGFAIYVVFLLIFVLASELINPLIGFFLNSLLGLYLAFEGTNWRAKKYLRNGWQEVDVVLASNYEEAEMRAFANRDDSVVHEVPEHQEQILSKRISQALKRPPSKTKSVIGSFPSPSTRSRS